VCESISINCRILDKQITVKGVSMTETDHKRFINHYNVDVDRYA